MADFETLVNDAVEAKEIPGCVLTATDRDGAFKYAKAFGKTSPNPEKAKPMELNSVMWIASCTKLLTAISVMQLVDRGLVTLDDPVYEHLPELKSFKVLKGWTETGEPIEELHKQPVTLRRLLSHTSGLAYDFFDPRIVVWNKYHNKSQATGGKILERFNTPLSFEPGESWSYGPGLDYAGIVIERVTKQRLDEYMKANIWGPLGITDMTFYLSARPDMAARMVDMSERDAETGKTKVCLWPKLWEDEKGNEVTDCMGGQGILMAADEYVKVLKALLECDNGGDGKILSKASAEELFKPQLGEENKKALAEVLKNPMLNNNLGGLPFELPKDHGLGGVLLMADSGEKKAGTMAWGGYPNLLWWIDRKTGYAGLYAQQMLPLGDEKVSKFQLQFAKTMYERLQKQRSEAKL